jgi:hypothetical protein
MVRSASAATRSGSPSIEKSAENGITGAALGFSNEISAFKASTKGPLLATPNTVTPSKANNLAVVLPIPWLAPVTKAVLPFKPQSTLTPIDLFDRTISLKWVFRLKYL